MIFPDIESYIEFLAGLRSAANKQLYSWIADPVIQLANYDVSFVASVAEQTMNLATPMSDRQAALSEKLIAKYERQMKKHGVEQPDHKKYRLGIRVVDRSSGAFLSEGKLHLKFQFDNRLILQIKEFAKTSHGKVMWDKDARAWIFALTEYNVSWAVALAHANSINVDADVQELFDLILEVEKIPYAIELNVDLNGLGYITNAPLSMIEYIEQHGGFTDLNALMDLSGMLGFTVHPDLTEAISKVYGETFVALCTSQTSDFTPAKYNIEDVIQWAIAVNRLPIYVVNPTLARVNWESYEKFFTKDEISMNQPSTDLVIAPGIKLVYNDRVLPAWQHRLPLLISYANLMHGTSKCSTLAKADKVVYYAEKLPRI